MATPAAINNWLDQLSTSILAEHLGHDRKTNVRKSQDAFRRRVRKHNFGRTNQFDVEKRLDGLEEKFQILSLDNLSDALRSRRLELRPYENHWLPDILDLLLHLSGNPAANQTLLELYRIPPRIGTPPPLKWNDLLADSPVDRNDSIWRVPDFREIDDSGYEDDFASDIGSVTTSPQQNRQQSSGDIYSRVIKLSYDPTPDNEGASNKSTNYSKDVLTNFSEVQFIRQALFALRGYDTHCFEFSQKQLSLAPDVEVRGLSQMTLDHYVMELSWIRQCLHKVVSWTSKFVEKPYIAAMQYAVEEVVQSYYYSIDCIQQAITAVEVVTVITLPSTMTKVHSIAIGLEIVSDLLHESESESSVVCLEKLYEAVRDSQLCGDKERYACLVALLMPTLTSYLVPVIKWMESGAGDQNILPPFVEITATGLDLRKIWNARFMVATATDKRAPTFLASTLDQILACGKTSAFLHELQVRLAIPFHDQAFTTRFELPPSDDISLPFTQAFEQAWQKFVEHRLHCLTVDLKSKLSSHCHFEQTLDSIRQLYLPQDSPLMHKIEIGIFDKIDHCADSWNDRFHLKDMLEDAYAESKLHGVIDSVTVHSAYISPRTMQSQRASVKILSSLSFRYVLSWPVANIISDASMASYRRIALMLMQIRRAKYSLERIGYLSAISIPLGPETNLADQTFAQVLGFALLTFVNTLFDSMMLSSVWPATDAMKTQIWEALTMEEMIAIHHTYITRLECSCLAAPRLKLLRQSLISILDLCIRFSDLVSNPTKLHHEQSDHEAGSFISAKSRNKSLRIELYGSEDEDEDDAHSRRLGDGYSSFIVLDDDTSIISELKKVKRQYEKQIKFLISGLQGVSKGGSDTADLDALAGRLAWLTAR